MKTLVLVRHAKSDWSDFDLQDFDRPLNNRGNSDALNMSFIISNLGIKPDLLLSSPALRAITTAGYFADVFKYSKDIFKTDITIYECSSRDIIDLIANTSDSINTLMLFGHNPCISSIASFLSSMNFSEIPTCGVVCFDFDVENWSELQPKNAKFRFYEYPKKYR